MRRKTASLLRVDFISSGSPSPIHSRSSASSFTLSSLVRFDVCRARSVRAALVEAPDATDEF